MMLSGRKRREDQGNDGAVVKEETDDESGDAVSAPARRRPKRAASSGPKNYAPIKEEEDTDDEGAFLKQETDDEEDYTNKTKNEVKSKRRSEPARLAATENKEEKDRVLQDDGEVVHGNGDDESDKVEDVTEEMIAKRRKRPKEQAVELLNDEDDEEGDDDDKNDEDAKEQPASMLVEFKFRSYKTYLFKEGDLKGILHVTMEQDRETGLYTIPVGTTEFHVSLDEVGKAKRWNFGKGEPNHFSGNIKRSERHGKITMDPGLCLDFYAPSTLTNFHASVRPKGSDRNLPPSRVSGTSESFRALDLNEWEKGQGGFINIIAKVNKNWTHTNRNRFFGATIESRYAEGDLKIKLYTVLSAHRPNEGENTIPEYEPGESPDWESLVQIVAARNRDKTGAWAERAVRQYRYFLELKLGKDGKVMQTKLSPSKALDAIWHAHLSFVGRYQKDMIQLTKGHGIIEHMPTHVKLSFQYYQRAYKKHTQRMEKLGLLPVDDEFWPTPPAELEAQHETCSDNEKVSAGIGSSYNTWDNSGCAGCG